MNVPAPQTWSLEMGPNAQNSDVIEKRNCGFGSISNIL
jgi:hypothetical protein